VSTPSPSQYAYPSSGKAKGLRIGVGIGIGVTIFAFVNVASIWYLVRRSRRQKLKGHIAHKSTRASDRHHDTVGELPTMEASGRKQISGLAATDIVLR